MTVDLFVGTMKTFKVFLTSHWLDRFVDEYAQDQTTPPESVCSRIVTRERPRRRVLAVCIGRAGGRPFGGVPQNDAVVTFWYQLGGIEDTTCVCLEGFVPVPLRVLAYGPDQTTVLRETGVRVDLRQAIEHRGGDYGTDNTAFMVREMCADCLEGPWGPGAVHDWGPPLADFPEAVGE